MKQEDKDRLKRERREYKERQNDQRQIRELQSQLAARSQTDTPSEIDIQTQGTGISQATGARTMMGGRNEQSNLRNCDNRSVSVVKSTRRISTTASRQPDPKPHTRANNELDTNADTCCLGTNFIVLAYTTRMADVYAYDESIQPIENVPIVSGATAFDDPTTGLTYILVFNESLYYGTKLKHSLINPNQLRHFGIDVWDNPFDKTRGTLIDIDDELKVPLTTRGTKIFFNTRVPTRYELDNCQHIDMTGSRPWEPSTVTLSEVKAHIRNEAYTDPYCDENLLSSINPCLVHLKELLSQRQIQTTQIDPRTDDIPARRTFVSLERHTRLDADTLADRFCIGPKRANDTLKVTTQRGVRSAILPIGQRYRADRIYRTKRLTFR